MAPLTLRRDRPASLSGFVYADTDNDGVKDLGESGIQTSQWI